ncbi:MAG: PEP-CTERM sorting domain-containing protein [Phycisphaerae bacterium]|nr:PEP-CTERM sorting domain-containing protein [Phycisphaerae bacterium]
MRDAVLRVTVGLVLAALFPELSLGSYAQSVVEFIPGDPYFPDAPIENILGAPDTAPGWTSVQGSIGNLGVVVVDMGAEGVRDLPGNDLIFWFGGFSDAREIFEGFRVEASIDGAAFFLAADVPPSADIWPPVPLTPVYVEMGQSGLPYARYLRITDLGTDTGHVHAGLELNAIEGLPEPSAIMLLMLGGLVVLQRRARRVGVMVIAAVVGVLLLSAASVRAADIPSFQGLGRLPNGELAMEPRSVSSNGDFVVGQTSGGNSFRWSTSDGFVLLGDSGHTSINTYAEGVSADGGVVVGSVTSAGKQDAFRWTPQQGTEFLESLSDGGGSTAAGLSADGRVVVGTSYSSSGAGQAFRYTPESGRQTIGSLPGWESGGAGLAVSADGSTGVGFSSNGDDRQAFRWTETTGTIGLGWLPTSVLQSTALGVSPDGGVVVGYCHHGPNEEEAFKWTIDGGMVGLGTPGGEQESYAYGVSQDGSIIVGEARGLTPQSVIWDNTHGARYLKQVLSDEYGLDLAGWGLERAYAISADGRVIVGRGANPAGQSEAWIAYIPEPATLLLLAIGGLAVMRRRRG